MTTASDRTGPKGILAGVLALFCLAFILFNLRWAVHGLELFKESDDSGTFLYIGQQIAEGAHPYRDVWDNKPPLIQYLNALGFLLTHSAAGVLLLCVACGAVLWWFLFRSFWMVTRTIWAPMALLLCLGGFWDLRSSINSVEMIALAFQAISLWILVSTVLKRPIKHGDALQGVCAALLMNTRFNLVGISVIWAAYCILAPGLEWRERAKRLARSGAAFLGTLILVYVPLFWAGSFGDAVGAFVVDGIRFASASTASRWDCLTAGLYMLSFSPITWFAGAGGLFLFAGGVRKRLQRTSLAAVAGAWLAVEFAMTCVSGFAWPHYFLLTLPPMGLMVAVAGAELDFSARAWLTRIRDAGLLHRLGVLATLAGCMSLIGFGCYDLVTLERAPLEGDQALGLARRMSAPGETVAAWGSMRPSFWFDLDRPSGMRLFHAGGFLNRPLYRLLCDRMLSDLEVRRPGLIIEKESVVPLFEPPSPTFSLQGRRNPSFFAGWDNDHLTMRKQELKQQYEEAGRDGPYVAWRLKSVLQAQP